MYFFKKYIQKLRVLKFGKGLPEVMIGNADPLVSDRTERGDDEADDDDKEKKKLILQKKKDDKDDKD